jgi:hypothetical protein
LCSKWLGFCWGGKAQLLKFSRDVMKSLEKMIKRAEREVTYDAEISSA